MAQGWCPWDATPWSLGPMASYLEGQHVFLYVDGAGGSGIVQGPPAWSVAVLVGTPKVLTFVGAFWFWNPCK